MKKEQTLISFLVLVLLSKLSFGQKYFLLENETDKYQIKAYQLSTEDLYQIKATVDIFNILFEDLIDQSNPEKTLVLFSALPSPEDIPSWVEVELDSIRDEMISIGKLRLLCEKSLYQRFDINYGAKTKFWDEYKIIIKRGGKHYTPTNCLLQFYAIQDRSAVFNIPYNTINISQAPNSITHIKELYGRTYPKGKFPVAIPPNDKGFNKIRDRREYLSQKFTLNNEHYYQFWTFTDWGQIAAKTQKNHHKVFFAYERGIDRFVYNANRLIVGGSYDFYFYHYKDEFGISDDIFRSNIIEEKVMMPGLSLL